MEEVFGYWITCTPLRQLNESICRFTIDFYKPQNTYRIRWTMYTDTPVPKKNQPEKIPLMER
jgi:hypothetical protein